MPTLLAGLHGGTVARSKGAYWAVNTRLVDAEDAELVYMKDHISHMLHAGLRSRGRSVRTAGSGRANRLGRAVVEDQRSASSPRRIQVVIALDRWGSYLASALED